MLGCNGLIYPISYDFNIQAHSQDEKVLSCNPDTIHKVNEILSKIPVQYGYVYTKPDIGECHDYTALCHKSDVDTAMFFFYKKFHIEIRGGIRKEETNLLGMDLLKALQNAFPNYRFEYKVETKCLSILN